jgi:hypothetical protein
MRPLYGSRMNANVLSPIEIEAALPRSMPKLMGGGRVCCISPSPSQTAAAEFTNGIPEVARIRGSLSVEM